MSRADIAGIEATDYVLGFVLGLSAVNALENAQAALARPSVLNCVQLVASAANALNTALFCVQNSVVGLPCGVLVPTQLAAYFVFQALASAVLIHRGTLVMRERACVKAKWLLGGMLCAAMAATLTSAVLRTDAVAPDGTCTTEYARRWNDVGKTLLFVIYASVLLCFAVPLNRHIRKMSRSSSASSDSAVRLSAVGLRMTIKISIALLTYLITTALSSAGVLGGHFYVQFSVQNYACILASTWSVVSDNYYLPQMPIFANKQVSSALSDTTSTTIDLEIPSGLMSPHASPQGSLAVPSAVQANRSGTAVSRQPSPTMLAVFSSESSA